MELISENSEDRLRTIQLKLSLLDSVDTGEVSKTFRINNFLHRTNTYISKAHENLPPSDGTYHDSFPNYSYQLLALSPFNSKAHLCKLFRCSPTTIDVWITEHAEFKEAFNQGIAEGEVKARALLAESSVEPGANVNTTILQTLVNNVYGIKDKFALELVDSPIQQLIGALSKLRHSDEEPE